MTAGELIVVAIAIFVAAYVYIIAGFGFALLAMPIMTLQIPVARGIVIITFLSAVTAVWQSIHLRAHTNRGLVRRIVLSAALGMPLGLVILNVVPDRGMRIGLGVGVLAATTLLARRMSLAHAGPNLDRVAGFVSGVLNTSIGTNGPPLVFDLQARGLTPDQFRATIQTVFALGNLVAIPLFVIDGKVTGEGLVATAVAVPSWLAGMALGWPMRKHLHGERFRWLVLALLAAAGVTAIVAAL